MHLHALAAPSTPHASVLADSTPLCSCGRDEDVQGVLTLFCSGAAQVRHVLRVVEFKEQLEVEEEDGDRQEEKEEVESGEASQGECAMWMTMDGV